MLLNLFINSKKLKESHLQMEIPPLSLGLLPAFPQFGGVRVANTDRSSRKATFF
jgi:hypothetical protein